MLKRIGNISVVAAISLGLATATTAWRSRAADDQTDSLRQEAQKAFKVQSYQQAIDKARAYLKTSPPRAQADQMQRMIGIAQIRLRQFAEGIRSLEDLLRRSPSFERDAEVVESLALALTGYAKRPPVEVIQWLDKAIGLYAVERNPGKQIDFLFRLAQFIESHVHSLRLAADNAPWTRQRVAAVTLVLKTYDRILALPASIDDQVRALRNKSETVLRHLYELQQIPRDQWPASIEPAYDVSRPAELAIEFQEEIIRRFPERPTAFTAMFRIGEIHEQYRRDYLAAIAVFRVLESKYPNSVEAGAARVRIKTIQAPQLSLRIEGVTLPGSQPQLHWHARNIKVIQLAAHPVDLFDVLRKLETVFELERYAAQLGKPSAEWKFGTNDRSDHQFRSSGDTPARAPALGSNAYIVAAHGANPAGQEVHAYALLLVSRLGVVVKTGHTKAGIFALDAVAGQPLPNTKVLIQRFVRQVRVPLLNIMRNVYDYQEHIVPDNGLVEVPLPRNEGDSWQRSLLVVARHASDYALSDAGFHWYWWGFRDGFRVYSMTDRPVYRPQQTIHFKHIVRRYERGEYTVASDTKVQVRLVDARDEVVYDRHHVTNNEGSISGSHTLGSSPALGMYRAELIVGSGRAVEVGPGAGFRVEEYKKPEFAVTLTPTKLAYKVGEELRVRIHGEYYFGGGVPNAEVHFTVYRQAASYLPVRPQAFGWLYDADTHDGHAATSFEFRRGLPPHPGRSDLVRRGTVQTDAHGDATLAMPTEPFPNTPDVDLEYRVDVSMVDQSRRAIRASSTIKVTRRAVYVSLAPQRYVYQPGDRVRVRVTSRNANGRPVPLKGDAKVSYVTQREIRDESGNVKTPERLDPLSQAALEVDADGESEFTFVAERAGYYRADISAPDPFGGETSATTYLWVAKGPGEFAHYAHRDLELVLDRDTVQAGETLRVLLNSKHKNAYVWLTVEGDDLYASRVVHIPGHQATLALAIPASYQPNVVLKAAFFRDNQIHADERTVKVPPVEKLLSVVVRSNKSEYRPRETAEVEIEVADHRGRPAAAEIALGVVDTGVLYIQRETRGDVRTFFHGRPRPHMVRTTSSFAFQFWAQGREASAMFYSRRGRGTFSEVGAAISADGLPAPVAAPVAEAKSEDRADRARQNEQFQAAEVRSEFADTVAWLAHMTTDANGKARTTVRFPDSLTTWRLTAVAVNGQTQVGENVHHVLTRKNVIVRLECPRFFVERDIVTLSVITHNYLNDDKTIRVAVECSPELAVLHSASAQANGSSGAQPAAAAHHVDIKVPAGGEKRADFRASARQPGNVTIVAKALSDVESDAVQLRFPILEYGADKLVFHSGTLIDAGATENTVSVRLTIPNEIRAGSQRLTVEASPSVAGVMLSALPYLLDYPYGCTEQTMSRFLPAVVTAHTLRQLGIDLGEIKADKDPMVAKRLAAFRAVGVYDQREMNRMIQAGLKRLADFQQADGGWGWWKADASNPYLTAYVVSGLALAAQANIKLPANMFERGVGFLVAQATRTEPVARFHWQREENTSVRAFLLYAIGEANAQRLRQPDLLAKLRDVYRMRDELNDYSRALHALALHAARMHEEAAIVLDNIKDRARIDEDTATASWGDYSGYYYWYQSGTEATSFSLKALLALEPTSPLIGNTVNWLVRHRKGTRWFNTKDTAIACYALAEYLKRSGELNPDLEIALDVDGRIVKSARVTRANLFTADNSLSLTGEALGTGDKLVTIRRKGRGNVYWAAYASFFTKEAHIQPGGNEVFVARQYHRLIPREVERVRAVFDPKTGKRIDEKYRAIEFDRKPLADGETVASGEFIEATLDVQANNNFEYVVFEDPKPAGCEPAELHSGYTWAGGLPGHVELRDEKVAFFATYLNQGKYHIRHRLRAESPGTFHALPARAECMYTPRVAGNSSSRLIVVADRP
jgi:uncharacterized protein YfaS (alpha-2-macroglobulin family)